MIVHRIEINIDVKEEFIDITDRVQEQILKRDIELGFAMVYTKHTTACIRVLENEELLKKDMHDFFERLASSNCLYRHDDIEHRSVPPDERRNGFSHLRAMLLNHNETIPIFDGKLDLGKWQRIFFIECDMGRTDRTFNILLWR